MNFPLVIQGGMGVAISNWTLARAVSQLGQLGVVSGTGINRVLASRLADGDLGGHMRRALASFRAEGLEAIPSPCDALVATSGNKRSVFSFIPSPGALEKTHAALWEHLGLAYYRVTGRA